MSKKLDGSGLAPTTDSKLQPKSLSRFKSQLKELANDEELQISVFVIAFMLGVMIFLATIAINTGRLQ